MEKPETRVLPVKLTEQEIRVRCVELVINEAELTDAEERLERHAEAAKAGRKQIEEELAVARAGVRRLAQIVREGKEPREVEVSQRPDFERGVMVAWRTDTGEEVGLRALTEAERQRGLFDVKEA